ISASSQSWTPTNHTLPRRIQSQADSSLGYSGLRELCEGRDWRRFPISGDRREYRAYRESADLTPPEAAGLVPLSLGLTEEAGRNAFASRRTAHAASGARDALHLWQMPGANRPALSPREARERVMEEYGFTDERAFRRFLKKGEGRVKPTGAE
ncbi:hypothetical protein, partial [Falsiroseomonas sp.]|uniref:hypothetical protein n=1 Tax=Falsiroseomonas sp. TaxID=2870721 RepID=UPI00356575E9